MNKEFPYTYRITHYNDFIVHVAPEIMGYKHYGNEIYYSADSSTY